MHATVTTKNQITVPEPIRRSLNLTKGDHLVFEPVEEGWILRGKSKELQKSDGIAKKWVKRKSPLSVEEMKEAAATEAARGFFGTDA